MAASPVLARSAAAKSASVSIGFTQTAIKINLLAPIRTA